MEGLQMMMRPDFSLNSFSCLVGEKPDKELPGIVEARGDTVKDIGYYLA